MSRRYFGDKMKKLSLIFILISFLSAKSYFVEFVNQKQIPKRVWQKEANILKQNSNLSSARVVKRFRNQ